MTQRPSLLHSFFEFRFPLEAAMFWVHGIHHRWPHADDANRKSIMLIPGFMAGDMSLAPMSGLCQWLGHKTFFTGIRSNSRCPRETLMHLESHLERIAEQNDSRVTIIGQSLGGLYARELAARRPELVERVITLGSPIQLIEESSNPFVIAIARLVARARNVDEGCMTPSCPCGIGVGERKPGVVPTTVIYSRTDGVVHWESCFDRSGASNVENVEVTGSHVGMGMNADVFKIVADRLALPRRKGNGASPARSTPHRDTVSNLA